MIVAAVVLTACGGEERSGTEAKGGGRSAVASDRATVTPGAVQDDIRAAVAAGDFGPPRFIAEKELLSSCVGAVVQAGTKPDPKAVAKVVTGLKNRGWRETMQRSFAVNSAWGLEKEGWMLNFVAGTVSENAVSFKPAAERQGRAEPFEGLVFRGVGACDAPSATASP
ncbi:hypothetical protein [Streptomyces sp. NPDC001275]